MAGQPRLLFPGARRLETLEQFGSSIIRVFVLLLARFSNSLIRSSRQAVPPSRHFDPFGTEFSVKPGQANHSPSIYKELSSFRRSSSRPRANRDFTVPILI